MKKISIFFSFLFLFTFFFVGSTYAAEIDFPPIPQTDFAYNEYVLVHYDNSSSGNPIYFLYVFSSNTPLTNSIAYKDNNYIIYEILDDTTTFIQHQYILTSSHSEWNLQSTTEKLPDKSSMFKFENVEDANINIYTSVSREEIFFQGTPVVVEKTLEETLAEEIPATQEKILQTMMIILLCGVGCLALVIGLNLFGKVFRIFQIK